ncbi:hypothetical protein QNI16_14515 [Cytophagaceae bacterium YF14B1]|uniref:Uncharacterized protein n=1 Tax=Xanthocytophaga flava TaxID=3048013 RepID=A0AAE3QMI7_9BACT|nr:hypothetical protein [Xanthocytophaga flavus]
MKVFFTYYFWSVLLLIVILFTYEWVLAIVLDRLNQQVKLFIIMGVMIYALPYAIFHLLHFFYFKGITIVRFLPFIVLCFIVVQSDNDIQDWISSALIVVCIYSLMNCILIGFINKRQ